jgi:hypothetical protein
MEHRRKPKIMRVKYEFNVHVYSDLEKHIPCAVETYNMAYVLKIKTFSKKATRWYFIVDCDFPKELSPKEVDMMKRDSIFRMGYFITCKE